MTRPAPHAPLPALAAAAASGSAPDASGLLVVAADDVAPQPWKNGGGTTRELLRLAPPEPRSHDDWMLRISLADIAADGPFSPFPGVARAFAVIEGAGVRLRWPAAVLQAAREHLVRAGDTPLAFDGAEAPDCQLLDGPTRDLNVMVRMDAAQAELALVGAGPSWRWPGDAHGVFAVQPLTLHREGHAPLALAARTLAWCVQGDTRPWAIAPASGAPAPMAQTGGAPASAAAPLAFRIGLAVARPAPR